MTATNDRDPTLGESLHQLGWRQGSIVSGPSGALFADVLTAAHRTDLAAGLISGTHCIVVVSQSCDIVCGRDDVEPFVEFLVARIADGIPEPSATYLKSFRNFSAPLDGEGRHLQFKPWDRAFIPRIRLLGVQRSASLVLSADTIRDLLDWLVTRFVRAALPTSFNERLASSGVEKAVRKLLDRATYITEIFVALRPRDVELLSANEMYECDVVCLCKSCHHECQSIREQSEETVLAIESTLAEAPGVQVRDVRLRGEHQFSRHDLRLFDRWQLDDISIRARRKQSSRGGDVPHQFRVELDQVRYGSDHPH